jgi:hypothetical protein
MKLFGSGLGRVMISLPFFIASGLCTILSSTVQRESLSTKLRPGVYPNLPTIAPTENRLKENSILLHRLNFLFPNSLRALRVLRGYRITVKKLS